MAFHIPCKQRHRKSTAPPVNVGFERKKKKFNWWGFHGLWLSVLSLSSAGFLSPLSLLVSVNGLRRKKGPRTAALLGTVVSLAGIALAVTIVSTVLHVSHQHQQRLEKSKAAAVIVKQRRTTEKLVASAIRELTQYRKSHQGFLPSVIDCNMLVIKHKDPWGEELRFDLKTDYGVVRSAGPDMIFETPDDVVAPIEGTVETQTALLQL